MPAKFQNDPIKNVGEDRNLRSENDHFEESRLKIVRATELHMSTNL